MTIEEEIKDHERYVFAKYLADHGIDPITKKPMKEKNHAY
jgi:hypothetical protein